MATAIELPYSFDALEPHIDAATMEVHYSKHYMGYTSKYNAAVEGTDLADKDIVKVLSDLDSVPADIRSAVRNNGGGYYNHTLFWQMMTPNQTTPSSDLQEAINAKFGSMDDFKSQFSDAAGKVFGSGWAWLCKNESGELQICSTANQDTPLYHGHKPLLGIDVWEHAYYLKNQNRRPEYIAAWWQVVNWEFVSELFAKA